MKAVAATGFLKKIKSPWRERGLLCLAVLLVYASVWPNEFVFDDIPLIAANGFLKHWNSLSMFGAQGGFYRPVQMLVYFLVYQAFGPSAVAFHALNIALHALNACLLFHFGVRAGFAKGAAFAAALLWAVHPLFTSDVAYMASTAELLQGAFCLLGLIVLLPDFAPQKIWKAMIFFALALGCKESAVVFPALAAAAIFFTGKTRVYLKIWPLWLLAGIYITVRLYLIHKSGYTMDDTGDPAFTQAYTSNLANRILTSFAALPVYARLIIWPAGLHIERIFPIFTKMLWQPAVGALLAALGLAQIVWMRRRYAALSFGLLWFALALSPYTGIVFPLDALINEGWLYLPSMGLFLGVMQTVAGFLKKKRNAARLLALALALALGITTFIQNKVWRNTETLYQSVLENGGHPNRIGSFLLPFYEQHHEWGKVIDSLQYASNNPADRTKAQWAYIHWEMAMALLHLAPDENGATFTLDMRTLQSCQHLPDVISELGKVLQYSPDFYWAHEVLAAIYNFQGDKQMAAFHLKQAQAVLQKQGSPAR